MKKHIFVATDGSDNARAAVTMAAEMAAKFDVPLTIGHVYRFGRPAKEIARMAEVEHMAKHVKTQTGSDFKIPTGGEPEVFTSDAATSDVVRVVTVIGDEVIRRATEHARGLGVAEVHSKTTVGDPADAILDMAEEAGADMIVVGSRGLGRLKQFFLGSVAQKVTQQATCSVMTVR